MRYLIAYGATGLVFGALDAIWLTVVGGRLYRPLLGDILAPKVAIVPAVAFYAIYLFGIVFLAIAPGLREGSTMRTVTSALVLGIVAYATYDLTNQATLRTWSTVITLADIGWGAFVTTIAAVAGLYAARWAQPAL
jgi:uncharacterized membrane protein